MDYVTTNIRLLSDDYDRVKQAASREKISMAAYIRQTLAAAVSGGNDVDQLMAETKKLAERNAEYLKDFDSLKVLRQMRESA